MISKVVLCFSKKDNLLGLIFELSLFVGKNCKFGIISNDCPKGKNSQGESPICEDFGHQNAR